MLTMVFANIYKPASIVQYEERTLSVFQRCFSENRWDASHATMCFQLEQSKIQDDESDRSGC